MTRNSSMFLLLISYIAFSNTNAFSPSLVQHKLSTTNHIPLFSSSSADTIQTQITDIDEEYMDLALSMAEIGFGQTYPNPAVGCVLVEKREDHPDVIIGKGFHPRSGFPHAEVFALFEASGHVKDGVAAAQSVLPQRAFLRQRHAADSRIDTAPSKLALKVQDLLDQYTSEKGAQELFQDCCKSDYDGITAYVTLEPCCHTGKTPPCSRSFVIAGVSRVVVGFRDPNPRVDGGGVKMLRDAGVQVDYFTPDAEDGEKEIDIKPETKLGNDHECAKIVECFVKRITVPKINYDTLMNGKKRRYLRSLANKEKSEGTISEITLRYVERRNDPRWMEELDAKLWRHELVIIRMKNALKTKKECSVFAGEIAEELNAHVAQILGRTALLYRPGSPTVIDLDNLEGDEANEEK